MERGYKECQLPLLSARCTAGHPTSRSSRLARLAARRPEVAREISLLLATLAVTSNAAGNGTNGSSGPCTATSDGSDACPGCRAYSRAGHRSLLLRAHVRAAHQCD